MRLIDADAAVLDARANYGGVHDAVLMEHFLNSQPTITPPPNAPLTLEELRKMDGEPVWVKRSNGIEQYYIAVSVGIGLDLYRGGCGYEGFADYGKTWLSYRRKPEEGTT